VGQGKNEHARVRMIFKETTDEFTVRVAKTPEEIKALLCLK